MKITTHTISQAGAGAFTLAAATETDVLGDVAATPTSNGIDTSQTDTMVVVLKNTGSNSIETVTLYQSPLGTNFVAYGANLGPVTAGSRIHLLFEQIEDSRIRLTCTSASGSTVEVECRGTRETV